MCSIFYVFSRKGTNSPAERKWKRYCLGIKDGLSLKSTVKSVLEMKPGDCINIPAEVKHWHGAAPDEWFSHLAIEVPGENSSNEWLEPVSDEEYRKLK